MRVVHQMVEVLQVGEVLAVFPEGTTSDGLQLLPFHANLIQAAISANAPTAYFSFIAFTPRLYESRQKCPGKPSNNCTNDGGAQLWVKSYRFAPGGSKMT